MKSLFYQKTLRQSVIEKKIDAKEAQKLNVLQSFLDKRTDIMKVTLSKVEDVFGDILLKDFFLPVQITKINLFFSQNDENIKSSINNFF